MVEIVANMDLGRVLLGRLSNGSIHLNRTGLAVMDVVFDRYPPVLEKWCRVNGRSHFAHSLDEGLEYASEFHGNLKSRYGKCVEEMEIMFNLMGFSLDEAVSFVLSWMDDYMEHRLKCGLEGRVVSK